jgi:hypothetical protein
MADWRFLRTGNKSNNHRSLRTCLFARRGSRMRRMGAHVAWAVPPRLASRLRMQQNNAPERSASARVQASGGAIAMFKGELVFDGVAISDTSATVRRPSDARAGRALRLRACGFVPDRRRVQGDGGVIVVLGGAVTFRGSSTITRARAVRPARRTPSRAHALLILACGASTGTATGV